MNKELTYNCHDNRSLLKTQEPLVSIIINNYNYGSHLRQAIDGALNQTYKNVEIIVVDDGSVDNSRDVIASYGNQIIPILKENGGQASALNAGFKASKGDIICLLDSDDIFLSNKAATIVEWFQQNPDIDWAFNESFPMTSEDISQLDFESIVNKNTNLSHVEKLSLIDFRNNIISAELPTFTPSTSNLCFSRQLLEKIFPLPEIKGFSGLAICDLYLKYVAVGIGRGYSSKKNLGIFRIHSNNRYTTQEINQKRSIDAEILMMSGYCMLVNFPSFIQLSQKLFSKGWANYLRSNNHKIDYSDYIKEYLAKISLIDRVKVLFITFYYFIKLGYMDLI
ncbi:glycosyltransferase family 2 protein [Calothrix sp. 336/3]|uniref:glycosyltransferase family 2 protein n=1 Tax=Calothrix sp. 336/3 TaxID=1337936 RepID=UPI000624E851|nr:glycosyltransferase family A protein [Calothrix sp. 336/3]AKG20951.1 hypothetical protein IJ00_06245 [Calothrix sp. 336/3]